MLLLGLVCGSDASLPERGGLHGAMALATLADMLQIADEVRFFVLLFAPRLSAAVTIPESSRNGVR
jgi:hypothetical protein